MPHLPARHRAIFTNLRLYRGIVARVADQLKMDRSHVLRVAWGERRSARIERALARELERVERSHSISQSPC